MAHRAGGPVLLVEDNAETRDVLARILHLRGYETVDADDGRDALDYLGRGGTASVIVLDMRMPNMDGVSFRRALRAEPRWSEIPVVIYSVAEPDDVEGAASVVQKGTDEPEVMLAAVQRACEQRGAGRPGRPARSSSLR